LSNGPYQTENGQEGFILTLDPEPDDLTASQAAIPHYSGRTVFRMLERWRASRWLAALRRPPCCAPGAGSPSEL